MRIISVIIPIYNVEQYIEECLESLLRQPFRECEFICIDDGSKDDSYRIVETYVKKDKRFRLIRQENKGLAEARNVGIRNAEGKYIAFLDSDDYLQGEDTLGELYKLAEENQADFLTFDADCFYESDLLRETDNRDSYYMRKKEYGAYSTGRELFCELIENDDFCDGACVLFLRKDWLLENNLWFPFGLYPEDCIWSFFCYMRAGRVKHIQKRYYKYRIRSNSLTTEKVSFDVIYGRIYTVREMLRFALTNTLSEREERAICKFIDIILWHMKDKFRRLEVREAYKLHALSPIDNLLARYMNYPVLNLSKCNRLLYMEGFKHILQSASGIIIYGAGKIGRLVYHYMKREQLLEHFHSFAVSKVTSFEEIVEGNIVRNVSDKQLIKSDLVLIAVTERYQEEMIIQAEKNGFTRILPVDEYVSRVLEEYYA